MKGTPYSPDFQNWSLTIKCSLVSYRDTRGGGLISLFEIQSVNSTHTVDKKRLDYFLNKPLFFNSNFNLTTQIIFFIPIYSNRQPSINKLS